MTTTKDKEPEIRFGPAPIQTAEDALQAYLREEISEETFRDACGKFGVLPDTLYRQAQVAPERPDAAFARKIPDDMLTPPTAPYDDLDYRRDQVDAKEKIREDAVKEAEKNAKKAQRVVLTDEATVSAQANPDKEDKKGQAIAEAQQKAREGNK